MKFVIVNDRVAHAEKCAQCAKPIGVGYLHEIRPRRFYCDHECFIAHKARVASTDLRTDSGIDGLPTGPFRDPYSFVFRS
ncbi:MAG TPA: hypothetical protein VNX23_03780 [Bradyrhizobium sp.]|jgi:hypothetical protein|uniref:hypothetical protein n=1 Tax=Bradyrhizobium sp. TaxID=376 RepID=UPI002C355C5D|nr:hypothetical protein [Bradyrhizobium sp.]HXB76525.1 hypothetical protein [Bradyrhizobium sp.]